VSGEAFRLIQYQKAAQLGAQLVHERCAAREIPGERVRRKLHEGQAGGRGWTAQRGFDPRTGLKDGA